MVTSIALVMFGGAIILTMLSAWLWGRVYSVLTLSMFGGAYAVWLIHDLWKNAKFNYALASKTIKQTLAVTFCCLLTGCNLYSDSIRVPGPSSVSSILISQEISLKLLPKALVQDKAVISRVLALLSANNRWRQPLDTFPTPRARALFQDDSARTTLILWFGTNWVGACDESPEPRNYLWDVEPSLREEIGALMNVDVH